MKDLTLEQLIAAAFKILKTAPTHGHWPRIIDADLALAALKRAWGPSEGTTREEAIRRIGEILSALLTLRPALASPPEPLAVEAMKELAHNMGFEITDEDLAELVRAETGGDVPSPERSVRIDAVLRERVATRSGGSLPPLKGLTGFSSRDTTIAETRSGRHLRVLIEEKLQDLGCLITPTSTPGPTGVERRQDRSSNPWREPEEVDPFAEHEKNLFDSQFLISFDDIGCVRGTVDRRSAADVGMPIFIVRRHRERRPAEDGWHQATFFDDNDSVEEIASAFVAGVVRFSDHIRDFAAYQGDLEIAGSQNLPYLRAAWDTLNREQRETVARRARVSHRRIDVALSSATGWAAASGRGRSDLTMALGAPRVHHGQVLHLRPREMELLGEACRMEELSHHQTLAVHHALLEITVLSDNKLTVGSLDEAVEIVRAVREDEG